MPITVADCLHLDVFKDAELLAGASGLDKLVNSVTVLEYAQSNALSDKLFLGDEIVISAFVSIKDDVAQQCATLKRLSFLGASALVLYYVGVFLSEVDQQLIDLAEEMSFPLLCMPRNRFDYTYREAISGIQEAVFHANSVGDYFVSAILEQIAQLPDNQRTFEKALQLLSAHLECSLIIVNRLLEPQYSALHGADADTLDCNQVVELLQIPPDGSGSICPPTAQIGGKTRYLQEVQVVINKNYCMYMIAISNKKSDSTAKLSRAAEALQLFVNIWKSDVAYDTLDTLIRAILSDDPVKTRELSEKFQLDLARIRVIWVIRDDDAKISAKQRQNRLNQFVLVANMFLKKSKKLVVAGIFEEHVVLMMEDAKYQELDSGLAEELFELLRASAPDMIMATFSHMDTLQEAREAYRVFKSHSQITRKIFPQKLIMNLNDLQFAMSCQAVADLGEQALLRYCSPLAQLRAAENGEALIETLTVLLLDANNNTHQAGEYLFVHKNTVSYRLRKIKQCLGYDLTNFPAAFNLYFAVGLERLIRK